MGQGGVILAILESDWQNDIWIFVSQAFGVKHNTSLDFTQRIESWIVTYYLL